MSAPSHLLPRLSATGFLALLFLIPVCASAQSADVASAEAETCNIDGNVSVTLLGITTSYPLPCVNETDQPSPGTDTASLVGTQAINVPVLSNVASVTAPVGESRYRNITNATVLFTQTGAEDVGLAQGVIGVDGVTSQLHCSTVTDSETVRCLTYFSIGDLQVNGQSVQLPPGGVPMGYTVPVTGASLSLTLGGIPVVVTGMSGNVVLNDVNFIPAEHALTIEQIPVSVDLTGSVSLLGVGLVQVHVTVRDPLIEEIRLVGNQILSQYTLDELLELVAGDGQCDPGNAQPCPTNAP